MREKYMNQLKQLNRLLTQMGQMVEYAIAGMDNQLFVSTYMLQLPDKDTLEKFLLEEIERNNS